MAGFTAGTISNHGLVRFFWKTDAERRNGIMTIPSQTDWLSRLSGTSAADGWANPTTTTPPKPSTSRIGNEWWSVWNYLGYGVGACVVGSTGDDIFKTIGITFTPLHSTSENLNAVFSSSGTTFNANAAADVAKSRGDCFAIIGLSGGAVITQPVPSSYSAHATDFGFTGYTGGAGANIIYVAGRKSFFLDHDGSGKTDIDKLEIASDVAGCFGRMFKNFNEWSIPAGTKRGAINGVLALEQSFSSTDQTNLLNQGVNPIVSIPGKGTYLMGNSTGAGASGAAGSTYGISNMHIVSILNYLKTSLKGIATDYLFEPNTETNRTDFVNRAGSVLQNVKDSGSISAYSVVCNPAENQGMTFTANVNITPVNVAETISLKVVNGSTTEIYTL
jgi:hypothetical protein